MKAEIIAVGTEVLMGEVLNTHAAWLSATLAELGIDVHHHVTVGDNPQRMQAAFQTAARRADCLILTGGLGPTDDDMTVQVLADCFGNGELISDPESLAAMEIVFQKRQIPMSSSNRKQALRPPSAQALANPIGTAPGLAWDLVFEGQAITILAFPGVPRELYALWPLGRDWLQARQKREGEAVQVLISRFLHFFGISESALAERLQDLMQSEQPSLAPYVGKAGIRLRVAAKADSEAKAKALIAPMIAEIRRRAGEFFLGEGDKDASLLESGIGGALTRQNWHLALAESCTGGLISSRLTDWSGSSSHLLGSFVTYSAEEKIQRLGVSRDTLAQCGTISPEVAREMALGLLQQCPAHLTLSITGLAGPEGDDRDQPPGLAFVGLAISHEVARRLKVDAFISSSETVVSADTQTAFSKAADESAIPHPAALGDTGWVNASERVTSRVFTVRVNPAYSRQDIKFQFSQYALFHLWQVLQAL